MRCVDSSVRSILRPPSSIARNFLFIDGLRNRLCGQFELMDNLLILRLRETALECCTVNWPRHEQSSSTVLLLWRTMGTRRGSEFLFPVVQEGGEKANVAISLAQMTSNFPTYLQAASMEDTRDTMHSFRGGRMASHNMDDTAVAVLMNTWSTSPQPPSNEGT